MILYILVAILLVSNIISIIFGMAYAITYGQWTLWNLFGLGYLATLFGNLMIIYLVSTNNIATAEWRKIKSINYLYLVYNIFSMIGLLVGNTIVTTKYEASIKNNILPYLLIYFSFFGLLVIGCLMNYLILRNLRDGKIERKDSYNHKEMENISYYKGIKGKLNIILLVLCHFFLLIGLTFSFNMVTRINIGLMEMAVSQYSLYYVFIMLGSTLLILTIKQNNHSTIRRALVKGLGISTSIFFLLPGILIPYTMKSAHICFHQAFGESIENPKNYDKNKTFLQSPFSLPAYFLSFKPENYVYEKDILYYEGKDKEGKVVKLYFDVYMPSVEDKQEEMNSTLIRIHGGAWVTGDKGRLNVLRMNRYFAQQGYTVFDIQYGLTKNSDIVFDIGTPEENVGNFTIDDMVNHIAAFINYMDEHKEKYNVNMDSVFISGGSAGGHLATTTGLAITSGEYQDIFTSDINIRGIIPFYPANGIGGDLNIDGREYFIHPEKLVDKDSPPCLIFQGTHDTLVAPKVSQRLQDEYIKAGNEKCAVLWMPLGAHDSNYHFTGYYNQIFLYHMERFMDIYK